MTDFLRDPPVHARHVQIHLFDYRGGTTRVMKARKHVPVVVVVLFAASVEISEVIGTMKP